MSGNRSAHPDLRADYVLANPPFNNSDWFRKDDDPALRDWQFGVPPRGNAIRLRRIAWPRKHSGFIHHLAPHGMAGFVLGHFWFLVKSKAARVIKTSDKATPDSLRKSWREPLIFERGSQFSLN